MMQDESDIFYALDVQKFLEQINYLYIKRRR